MAQTPAPPYDPNDPEGLVIWPNKMGRYAHKRKGHWKITPLRNTRGFYGQVPAANAAEQRAMTATLDVLSALLRVTPEGGNPAGYWMHETRLFDYPHPPLLPAGMPAATIPFRFASGFFPFYIEDVLKNGQFVQAGAGETESVYFEFNLLPGRFQQAVIAKENPPDKEPVEMYLKPQVTATYAGFPLIDGQDLMIARKGRDPWLAVSYGRALKAAMAEFEKDRVTAESRLADLKKRNEEAQSPEYEKQMRDHLEKTSGQFRTSNPSRWQTRLAGMERELRYNRDLAAKKANPQRDNEGNWYWQPLDAHANAAKRLAAMTPEEAARPACFLPAAGEQGRYAMRGTILVAGSNPDCRELVTDNYAYFDPKLPRGTAQLLLVHSMGRCASVVDGKLKGPVRRPALAPPQGCFRHVPIWEAMDWSKVGALIVP